MATKKLRSKTMRTAMQRLIKNREREAYQCNWRATLVSWMKESNADNRDMAKLLREARQYTTVLNHLARGDIRAACVTVHRMDTATQDSLPIRVLRLCGYTVIGS